VTVVVLLRSFTIRARLQHDLPVLARTGLPKFDNGVISASSRCLQLLMLLLSAIDTSEEDGTATTSRSL
jgi:hypothetical protein